ncbi:MAG TPA: YqaJ viral recombinase family protein [Candidatus Saccharimonadales bacterium]|nr:YqaJ viral recombinase family protein [Candidatus Saccharimonadales bacterium]
MEKQQVRPIAVNAEQRSSEWFEARLGKVTGSQVMNTMSYMKSSITKGKMAQAEQYHKEHFMDQEVLERLRDEFPFEFLLSANLEVTESETRFAYRRATVAERFTGQPADPDPYVNKAMQWGMMNEDIAKTMYQLRSENIVTDAPFMLHPELACGASPDGIVTDRTTGEIGNIEIKCLNSANHLYKIMLHRNMPNDYIPQVQMQMWIDSADWCDFVGFDSRVKEGLRLFIQRVERDNFYINYVLEPSVRRFLKECDDDERQFTAIMLSKKDQDETTPSEKTLSKFALESVIRKESND